ncbi:MAG: cyclic nucleotide-binding domain-containing protein [Bdellovibrio sp.]|nr:cyclic nucleotide-binding domain-containing protein [Bdellovibrio sp.]
MVTTSLKKPTSKMLSDINLLKPFNEKELEKLISVGAVARYEPHTNIIIEGELSWGLYIILEGVVGILKTNKLTGENYDVGQLRSGNFFGEMSLVDENPRSATVRTLSNADLFYISKDAFIQFLNQTADLKLRFYMSAIKTLVSRLRALDDDYVISQYQLWQTVLRKDNGKS